MPTLLHDLPDRRGHSRGFECRKFMRAFALQNHGLGFGHGEKGRPLDASTLDATHPRSFVTGSITEHQTSDGTKPIMKIMYRGVNDTPWRYFLPLARGI